MARQTNAAYWAQRMKNMEDALLDQSYSYVENLEKQFAAAQAEIERQIGISALPPTMRLTWQRPSGCSIPRSSKSFTGPWVNTSPMASKTPLMVPG
ncbi:MAG: hypothetical protein ACLSF6_03245 [Evtepia gabavorous]